MGTLMTYTFIIGNILAAISFNNNALEVSGWAAIIANVLPAIYLVYKAIQLGGTSVPGPGICD